MATSRRGQAETDLGGLPCKPLSCCFPPRTGCGCQRVFFEKSKLRTISAPGGRQQRLNCRTSKTACLSRVSQRLSLLACFNLSEPCELHSPHQRWWPLSLPSVQRASQKVAGKVARSGSWGSDR